MLGIAVLASAFTIASPVLAYNIVFGNRDTENVREEFENSLNTNSLSTVIDDGTNFGAVPNSANFPDSPNFPSVASVPRSGTIDGKNFTYTIYDIDFSDSPNGSLTPGSIGGDIEDLDNVTIEIPAGQEGANGIYDWGVDSSTGSGTSNAALFDFTGNSIGHFGVDLHDFEAGFGIEDPNSGASGEIRIYQSGNLVQSYVLQFPGPNGGGTTDNPNNTDANDSKIAGYGNRQSMFVGITANNSSEFFDRVVFVLGDDDVGNFDENGMIITSDINDGSTERWAADGFTFGEAYQQEIPFEFSPTIGFLIVGGLWASNRIGKKLEKSGVKTIQ